MHPSPITHHHQYDNTQHPIRRRLTIVSHLCYNTRMMNRGEERPTSTGGRTMATQKKAYTAMNRKEKEVAFQAWQMKKDERRIQSMGKRAAVSQIIKAIGDE